MLDWFKKKEATIAPPQEPKIDKKSNPIYREIVSHENIAKLKTELVKSISEAASKPKEFDEVDKKILINYFFSTIVKEAKKSSLEEKDTVYLFGSHINDTLRTQLITKYGIDKYNYDNYKILFKMISSDLCNVLLEIGINAKLSTDGQAITLSVSDIKKFCNYEKLVVLK